jgi:hypothetical protein
VATMTNKGINMERYEEVYSPQEGPSLSILTILLFPPFHTLGE